MSHRALISKYKPRKQQHRGLGREAGIESGAPSSRTGLGLERPLPRGEKRKDPTVGIASTAPQRHALETLISPTETNKGSVYCPPVLSPCLRIHAGRCSPNQAGQSWRRSYWPGVPSSHGALRCMQCPERQPIDMQGGKAWAWDYKLIAGKMYRGVAEGSKHGRRVGFLGAVERNGWSASASGAIVYISDQSGRRT